MQSIKESYDRLLNSKEFKNEGFLCSVFLMTNAVDLEKSNWQIDFYEEKSQKIISYTMDKTIKVEPKAEVFKEENKEIEKLDLTEIKVDLHESITKSKMLLNKYKEEPTTIIIVLQKQGQTIWNISYVTKKFNLLNVKIDAITGVILEEKLASLLSFKKD